MGNDYCYRLMSDNQLQVIYKGISRRLKENSSDGMEKELKLVKDVAEERGLQL